MRSAFEQELDRLTRVLVDMARLAATGVGQATRALLRNEEQAIDQVRAADRSLSANACAVEDASFQLLARQQPVASDLRRIVTGLRIASDLERAGNLTLHIAELAERRSPARAIPDELTGVISEMGFTAQRLTATAGGVIATDDVPLARQLERDDDDMDRLQRNLSRTLLLDEWTGTIEQAVDVTLCGRYYERIGDHAVSVARRTVYLITGERDRKHERQQFGTAPAIADWWSSN